MMVFSTCTKKQNSGFLRGFPKQNVRRFWKEFDRFVFGDIRQGEKNVKEGACVCASAFAESSFAVLVFNSSSEVRHVPGTWHSTKH